MAGREIFLNPFDFYPIPNRFDVDWQWLWRFFTALLLAEFGVNLSLCNTQQLYSPSGEGE